MARRNKETFLTLYRLPQFKVVNIHLSHSARLARWRFFHDAKAALEEKTSVPGSVSVEETTRVA